jgi:xylulokinase
MRYVLGIDLGTSSLKAVALTDDGTGRAAPTLSYPIRVPHPGWAEQDPEDWWEAARSAIRALLDGGMAADAVAALAVGGQMHGTVLLDETGAPVRPAIIWPDSRTGAEAARAEEALALLGLIPRLGGGVAAGFMLASLLWIREHEPDTWRHVARVLLPKDYLRFRLTGIIAAEPSDGSGVPAIDLPRREWSQEALAALELPKSLFPPVRASTAVAGALTDDAARATGLRPGTPVLMGGSDQAMAAIGSGLLHPGSLLISISTGGQIVTPLAAPLPDPVHGLRTLCHAVDGTYLALSATLGAGLSLRWLREAVFEDRGEGSDARLTALAATAPPGAGGLIFLPYLAGERAPLLDPAAGGLLLGLRLEHGRAHLARAALEGVAMSLLHALEPLQEAGVQAERVILAGGLAQSDLMRRIIAGVLDRPIIPLEAAEQSALGAALLAGVHAGFYPTLAAACSATVQHGKPVAPDPAHVTRYADLYQHYRALYPKLREEMHSLRAAPSLPQAETP